MDTLVVLTLTDALGSFDPYGYFVFLFLLTLGQFGWSGLIRQFGSLGHLDTIKNVDPQKKTKYYVWLSAAGVGLVANDFEEWCERNFDKEERDGLREKLSLLKQYKQKSNLAFQRCDVRLVCQMQIQTCWGLQENCRVSCIYVSFDPKPGLHKTGRILP